MDQSVQTRNTKHVQAQHQELHSVKEIVRKFDNSLNFIKFQGKLNTEIRAYSSLKIDHQAADKVKDYCDHLELNNMTV